MKTKGRHGGARPNPGPKPKPAEERRRNRVMLNLDDEEYRRLVEVMDRFVLASHQSPKRRLSNGLSVYAPVHGAMVDPEYAKIAYLRPWQQYDLSKTGDSIRRQMLVEWTLEVCNEAAHGGIFDVDNT